MRLARLTGEASALQRDREDGAHGCAWVGSPDLTRHGYDRARRVGSRLGRYPLLGGTDGLHDSSLEEAVSSKPVSVGARHTGIP
jgi:hypothetical protein